jgi:hypothetical protein
MDHQQQFVNEAAALDRAFLNGTLDECLGSLHDRAMEDLSDEPSGDDGNVED